MEVTNFNAMFGAGFVVALAIIFVCWLIYRYFKWVDKVTCELNDIFSKLNEQEYYIDNLKARVKGLENRINNTSHNEEGIGSINPSEADTE